MHSFSSRGRGRSIAINPWPGWVDALSSLVMVIMFVLMVFVLAQFALTAKLTKPSDALEDLNRRAEQLAQMLSLERSTTSSLRGQISDLTNQLTNALTGRAELDAKLKSLQDQQTALESAHAELQKQATAGDQNLAVEQALSAQAREQVNNLTKEIEALRQQLATLSNALQIAEKSSVDQKIQIAELGRQLNGALASKVTELARYRSEFFGRLRDKLADRPDIRVVGDRFMVQSEVLFSSGKVELGDAGKTKLADLAQTLKNITADIPDDIDWILRVDGHTDRKPEHSSAFSSNWELSSARALAVLKFLIEQGIPPERLAATGFGEFQPLDKGNDDTAYARNRRIELRFDSR